jgi:hypothetical protein
MSNAVTVLRRWRFIHDSPKFSADCRQFQPDIAVTVAEENNYFKVTHKKLKLSRCGRETAPEQLCAVDIMFHCILSDVTTVTHSPHKNATVNNRTSDLTEIGSDTKRAVASKCMSDWNIVILNLQDCFLLHSMMNTRYKDTVDFHLPSGLP